MPYCPNCLTEYVEGITTCADCGVTLMPGDPPEPPAANPPEAQDDSRLVSVRVFTGATALLDAEVARLVDERLAKPRR